MSSALLLRIDPDVVYAGHENVFDCSYYYIFNCTDSLDAIATRSGVIPISNFFGMDPSDAVAFLSESGITADEGVPPIPWHPIEAGVNTLSILYNHINEIDCDPDYRKRLRDEIALLLNFFKAIDGKGCQFFFSMDF